MNLGQGAAALGAVLSLGAGGITLYRSLADGQGRPRTVLSQAGRDQVVLRMVQTARKSVYLRTEALSLVPVGNELALALQRGVSVTVDLPLGAGLGGGDSRIPRILMELGAVVTFKGDTALNYCGTLLVVDGHRFLYSALPLTLSPKGALVSYVAGPVEP